MQARTFSSREAARASASLLPELLASRLYERLLEPQDFVAYSIEEYEEKPHSVCENFITEHTQLVPLREVMSCFRRPQYEPYNYAEYVEVCNELGVADIERQLAKMIVCDFLTANIDRHDMNLGLIRDSETLQFVEWPRFSTMVGGSITARNANPTSDRNHSSTPHIPFQNTLHPNLLWYVITHGSMRKNWMGSKMRSLRPCQETSSYLRGFPVLPQSNSKFSLNA